MNTADAFETIKKAVQYDDSYAWSWHCSIAMASIDEGMDHAAANRAASRFMQNTFGVDTNREASSMSDTPRTDNAAIGFARVLLDKDRGTMTELVESNFARGLERELSAANKRIQELESCGCAAGVDACCCPCLKAAHDYGDYWKRKCEAVLAAYKDSK